MHKLFQGHICFLPEAS